MSAEKQRRITIHEGPDSHGRHQFTIEWTEPNGVFRTEIGADGKVVGYRRGQVFRARLTDYVKPGDVVIQEGA